MFFCICVAPPPRPCGAGATVGPPGGYLLGPARQRGGDGVPPHLDRGPLPGGAVPVDQDVSDDILLGHDEHVERWIPPLDWCPLKHLVRAEPLHRSVLARLDGHEDDDLDDHRLKDIVPGVLNGQTTGSPGVELGPRTLGALLVDVSVPQAQCYAGCDKIHPIPAPPAFRQDFQIPPRGFETLHLTPPCGKSKESKRGMRVNALIFGTSLTKHNSTFFRYCQEGFVSLAKDCYTVNSKHFFSFIFYMRNTRVARWLLAIGILTGVSIAVGTIKAQTSSQPDFVIENAAYANDRVSFTIKNQGTARASGIPSIVVRRTWLRADGTTIEYGNQEIINDAIAAGGMVQYRSSYVGARPAAATAFRLTADAIRAYDESNEENNTVTLSVPVSSLADLLVENVRYERAEENTYAGGRVAYTVRNASGVSVPTPRGVGYQFRVRHEWLDGSGAVVGSSYSHSSSRALGPGQTDEIESRRTTPFDQFIGRVPPTAQALRITVDADSEHAESNENNNVYELNLPGLLLPDLTIENLELDPFWIRYSIRNAGSGGITFRTPYFFPVLHEWLGADGAVLSSAAVGLYEDTPAGASIAFDSRRSNYLTVSQPELPQFIFERPTRAVSLRVTVDAPSAQREANENNNVAMASLPLPNFTLENAGWNGREAVFTIRNTGGSMAAGTAANAEDRGDGVVVSLQWLDGDGNSAERRANESDYAWRASRRLAAGEAVSIDTGRLRILPGDARQNFAAELSEYITKPPEHARSLAIKINSSGEILETDSGDNQAILLRLLPDLAIVETSVSMTYNNGRADDRLYATFKNEGRGWVAPGTIFEIETSWLGADGVPILNESLHRSGIKFAAGLAPGEDIAIGSEIFSLFWDDRPAVAASLRIVADPRDFIGESNEENNISGAVLPRPDLAVISGVVSETARERSDGVEVREMVLRYAVRNIAQGRTLSPLFTVQYQWVNPAGQAVGGAVTSVYRRPFGPNYLHEVIDYPSAINHEHNNFFMNRPAGAARLLVTVDPENAHAEANENNNGFAMNLLVPETEAEDLVLEDETVTPEDVGEEDEPSVTPDNPLYAFKRVGQGVRLALTVDDEKEADLRQRYANEKVLEIQKMSNDGKKDAVEKHLKRYEKDVERLERGILDIRKKDVLKAEIIAAEVVKNNFHHQIVLGKIEKEADSDSSARMNEARILAARSVGRIAATISPDKIAEIAESADNEPGSPLRSLRNAETLALVRTYAPAEAQDALAAAEERSRARVADQISAVAAVRPDVLDGYAEKVGGDDVLYLGIMDAVKRNADSESGIDGVAAAKERFAVRAADRLAAAENIAQAERVFLHAKSGRFVDVRAVKDIEERLDAATAERVITVTGGIREIFNERITSLSADGLLQELKDKADVRDVAVLKEAEKSVPEEKRAEVARASDTVARDVARRVQIEAVKLDGRIDRLVGESPQDAVAANFVAARLSNESAVQKLVEAGGDALKRRIEAITDPARAVALEQAIEQNIEVKKSLQRTVPDISAIIKEKKENIEIEKRIDLIPDVKKTDKRLEDELNVLQNQAKEDARRAEEDLLKKQEEDRKKLEEKLKDASEKEKKLIEVELMRKQAAERAALEAEEKKRELESVEQEKRRVEAVLRLEREKSCAADGWKCGDWSSCLTPSLSETRGKRTRACAKKPECAEFAISRPVESEACVASVKCTDDRWDCSNWSACGETGKRTRTCTIGFDCSTANTPKPAETESCAYVPDCKEDMWSCTSWSACAQTGQRTRTCTLKFDCPTADTPKLAETGACVYTPACVKDEWTCTWSACAWVGPGTEDGKQSVTGCQKTFDCASADTLAPYKTGETRVCSATKPAEVKPACTSADWVCGVWSACSNAGTQTRTACTLPDTCADPGLAKPATSQSCTPVCTSAMWSCSDWSACGLDPKDPTKGLQTRTCAKTVACSGGAASPATNASCESLYPKTLNLIISPTGAVTLSGVEIQAGGTVYVNNYQAVSHSIKFGFGTTVTAGKNSLNMPVSMTTKLGTYGIYLDGASEPVAKVIVR